VLTAAGVAYGCAGAFSVAVLRFSGLAACGVVRVSGGQGGSGCEKGRSSGGSGRGARLNRLRLRKQLLHVGAVARRLLGRALLLASARLGLRASKRGERQRTPPCKPQLRRIRPMHRAPRNTSAPRARCRAQRRPPARTPSLRSTTHRAILALEFFGRLAGSGALLAVFRLRVAVGGLPVVLLADVLVAEAQRGSDELATALSCLPSRATPRRAHPPSASPTTKPPVSMRRLATRLA
jgi:hypothetical protein